MRTQVSASTPFTGHSHTDVDQHISALGNGARTRLEGGVDHPLTLSELMRRWKHTAQMGYRDQYKLEPKVILIDHVRDFDKLYRDHVDPHFKRFAMSETRPTTTSL